MGDVQEDKDQISFAPTEVYFLCMMTLKLTKKVRAEIFEVRSALIQGI